MFFPCLCSSLCQQQQWDLGLGCVRLPLILLAIIHGHLSLFTYSCKPKDDNPSGDSEDYSDHFFFQWSKEGAMNYVLFTASGGVLDIFIGLLQRSKFVFLNAPWGGCSLLIYALCWTHKPCQLFFCALLLESREVALILGRPRECLSL